MHVVRRLQCAKLSKDEAGEPHRLAECVGACVSGKSFEIVIVKSFVRLRLSRRLSIEAKHECTGGLVAQSLQERKPIASSRMEQPEKVNLGIAFWSEGMKEGLGAM